MKYYVKNGKEILTVPKDGSLDHMLSEDMREISEEEAYAIMNPEPTPEELVEAKLKYFDSKIAEMLDEQAQSMGFDNITTAVTNAMLPIGEFRQDDGAAFLLWRSRVWRDAKHYKELVLLGEMQEPTWEELKALLPTYPIDEDEDGTE